MKLNPARPITVLVWISEIIRPNEPWINAVPPRILPANWKLFWQNRGMAGRKKMAPDTSRRLVAPKRSESGNSLAGAGCALRRAALVARKTARAHGTPIYLWRNGKVVAEKP
jgi:hypothetical protein